MMWCGVILCVCVCVCVVCGLQCVVKLLHSYFELLKTYINNRQHSLITFFKK